MSKPPYYMVKRPIVNTFYYWIKDNIIDLDVLRY